ncbi:MAG TPA: O-antigen ligase family protein [Actinomycetota bacterium]
MEGRREASSVSQPTGRSVLDAAGVVLVGALATISVTRPVGDAGPQLQLLAAASATLIGGRLLASIHRAVPAALVAGTAGGIVIRWWPDLIGTGPLGGPFGYENATGAFFVQAAFAGAVVAAATRSAPLVALGLLVAAALGAVAVQASVAAWVTLGLGLVAIPALFRPRWARPAVLAAGALFLAVLATTLVLGAGYRAGEGGGALRSVLTERRVVLWHESLEILLDHPGGIGPGRFAEVAPTALADRDARWAHNAFLQQGAELGWIGLGVTVLLFLWGFARLWAHPHSDAVVALGAAALAALGIHASVDYVLHFPAVPLAAAALVGAAQAAPRRRLDDRRERDREEGIEGGAAPVRVGGSPPAR